MNNGLKGARDLKMVSPEDVLMRIEPGMNIFLGTGVAEPRTLVKHLMASEAENLQDLELTQLVSIGDAVSLKSLRSQKCRLKTFFYGSPHGPGEERRREQPKKRDLAGQVFDLLRPRNAGTDGLVEP